MTKKERKKAKTGGMRKRRGEKSEWDNQNWRAPVRSTRTCRSLLSVIRQDGEREREKMKERERGRGKHRGRQRSKEVVVNNNQNLRPQ